MKRKPPLFGNSWSSKNWGKCLLRIRLHAWLPDWLTDMTTQCIGFRLMFTEKMSATTAQEKKRWRTDFAMARTTQNEKEKCIKQNMWHRVARHSQNIDTAWPLLRNKHNHRNGSTDFQLHAKGRSNHLFSPLFHDVRLASKSRMKKWMLAAAAVVAAAIEWSYVNNVRIYSLGSMAIQSRRQEDKHASKPNREAFFPSFSKSPLLSWAATTGRKQALTLTCSSVEPWKSEEKKY